MTRFKQIVLWLFIMFLGISFGAGVYESRIVVPDWTTAADGAPAWNPELAKADDTGRRFWAFVTTVPMTVLAITSLVLAWRTRAPLRKWWLSAASFSLADRVVTFAYFIPSMVRLMDTPDSAAARAAASQWASVNHIRHALVLVAWLLALRALSLLHARNESP